MTFSTLDAAREAPDRTALILGGTAVSFGELARRVASARAALAEEGLTEPVPTATPLVGKSDPPTLERVYALIEMGQAVALLHPRLTPEERAPLIALVRAQAPAPSAANGDESALAVLFTSGTTGEPKGVLLSRRAFLASARASAENLGFVEDERWLLGLPIAHVGGLSVLARCWLARRAMVVPEEAMAGARLGVEGLVRCLERDRVTLVSLVPTQLEWLLDRKPRWTPPPSLRAVLLGGAAARPALLAEAAHRGVPVLTTYGLTEACSQVTTERLGAASRGDGSVGPPISGTEVRLGEDGAIAVRGPTLFSGYLTRSGLTHPLDEDGFFHTDDLGRIDAEGRLHIVGRRSDTIITGGENVYPAEVEAVLERCPGIARACVFGVPDPTWGELVAVALVVKGHPRPSDEALAAFIAANLAVHRRPRRVARVTDFEITPAGKLDRKATARAALPRLEPLPR